MPGIDFSKLRREIPMEEVLNLLGFQPVRRMGDQWYGPCPFHERGSERADYFSVNVASRRYHCHKCRRYGNQLELWADFIGLPLHPASIDLCLALGREVPWIHCWR
jgi:DNA primase